MRRKAEVSNLNVESEATENVLLIPLILILASGYVMSVVVFIVEIIFNHCKKNFAAIV